MRFEYNFMITNILSHRFLELNSALILKKTFLQHAASLPFVPRKCKRMRGVKVVLKQYLINCYSLALNVSGAFSLRRVGSVL